MAVTDKDKMVKGVGGEGGIKRLCQWAVFDGGNGQQGRRWW
jgi:hypothetical protein